MKNAPDMLNFIAIKFLKLHRKRASRNQLKSSVGIFDRISSFRDKEL